MYLVVYYVVRYILYVLSSLLFSKICFEMYLVVYYLVRYVVYVLSGLLCSKIYFICT